jgi:hypothetical protein
VAASIQVTLAAIKQKDAIIESMQRIHVFVNVYSFNARAARAAAASAA